jgi:hypothetical protein
MGVTQRVCHDELIAKVAMVVLQESKARTKSEAAQVQNQGDRKAV